MQDLRVHVFANDRLAWRAWRAWPMPRPPLASRARAVMRHIIHPKRDGMRSQQGEGHAAHPISEGLHNGRDISPPLAAQALATPAA